MIWFNCDYAEGAQRTDCMFWVHLEKETNRFQRMKLMHPQIYEFE